MPIYEIQCDTCGKTAEVLVVKQSESLKCPSCGSDRVQRVMSATSSLTGRAPQRFPGPKDTGCCGHSPAEAHCAGPGSCCGRNG
jgi:putative FmdB family regulatory protein